MLRDGSGREARTRYRVVGPLGSGSYGTVHEAIDLRSGQRVAIKELVHTSAQAIARFKHEFRALADFHHPNLVGLKELIEERERWLIVMELVPGSSFLEYVTRAEPRVDGARFDEPRLRHALLGITEGLSALHGYGVLHRDLKPSNVRVRPDGHAVLLDFGLATHMDGSRSLAGHSHGTVVGTVAYMAPEQAAGERIGPAADLYALGVCLFEALTGRLPFHASSALQLLIDKQERSAPRAASLARGVPADLDALCAALLARDPRARPSADALLAQLSGSGARVQSGRVEAPPKELFTGRESELDHLARALARTLEGELRIVLIEGESGVGKSELSRELSRRAHATHPTLLALWGRCYENEQVAYKAFDGCIDELARHLQRLPEAERAALLPVRASLLGQLFPVLREVKSIDKAPHEGGSADFIARRLEAFAALADLLRAIAEERPLLLFIDDLQWADAESFRLLTALVEQPVRPPLLVIATMRPRDELEPEVLAAIERVRSWKHTSVIGLFGLPLQQARALAREWLGPDTPDAWLDAIAVESGGHPLFLSELVHYSQSREVISRGKLTLEAALRARIARLDVRSKALIELVAVAARPRGAHIFASALGVGSIDEPLRTLLAAKLVKLRKDQEVGCFHDRIRHAVTALIAKAELPILHELLAAALAGTPNADPTEQAQHWELAGRNEHAITAYELAAARAREVLAFGRAAQLYARALALCERAAEASERTQRLSVGRAHALACTGQSAEAAVLYRRAAERAEGPARIRLESRAAQQLMLSAKIAEGFASARAVLGELGVSMPRGFGSALLRHAWDVLMLSLAGGARRRPQDRRRDGARKLALEVMLELLYPLSMVHPLAFFVLSIQMLRRASSSSDHAAIGHTMRGWLRAAFGSLHRAEPLFALSRRMLAQASAPLHQTSQIYLEGSARLAGLDFPGAARCLETALARLASHCPEQPWLLTNTRHQVALTWYQLGKHGEMAREMVGWLAEARERNDTLAIALLTGMGHGFIATLMRDEPEAALAQIESAVAEVPAEPFAFVHFGELIGAQFTLRYQGGPAALAWFRRYEARYRGAFLLRTRLCRKALAAMEALALLSACEGADPSTQRRLLRTTRRRARRLYRQSAQIGRAIATLIIAQISALEGRTSKARQKARIAGALFTAIHHHGRHYAAYLDALCEAGPTGSARCTEIRQWFERQGWQHPARALRLFLPLLPLLERARDAARAPDAVVLAERYELLGRTEDGHDVALTVRDLRTNQRLALRALRGGDERALEYFKREFRTLSALHHPNLARVDAMFSEGESWYIAMEHAEGDDLIHYVRRDGSCHVGRTRRAFLGIAHGLRALHDAGFVHRNLTPASVRVSRDERAVLRDFSRMARIGEREPPATNAEFAAPEQRAGALPHQRADVYALGACLHVALYGVAPDGAPQPLAAEADRELAMLSALAARMLSAEPDARPSLRQVIELLGSPSANCVSSRPPASEVRMLPRFLGRERELARLRENFERTCDVGFLVTIVTGESGLGKSSLVAEFAHRELARYPSLQVLSSRCYEREALALNAFDGAVEQLAALLRALPNPVCEALLPRSAALLGQLFPALVSVPAIEQASRKGLPAEPSARRLAGQQCFVALLERLSAHFELILVIDDLQWADPESFALLAELAARGDALPVLCMCTLRPTALPPEVAAHVGALTARPTTDVITLEGLSEAAATSLAEALHGSSAAHAALSAPRLAGLVRESKGHPLFLRELIAHEQSGTREAALSLDAALRARIATFDADTRTLLGLMALGEKPHAPHVYARAMGRAELPRETLATLLAQDFVRRGRDTLSCYHDRIRQAAAAMLDQEARRALSRQLAEALTDEPCAEPAERARLWDEAGEYARAIDAYEEAGDRALEGLSFGQAERHYARALALLHDASALPFRDARTQRLTIARGHALGRAGKSAEAARVYQGAAAHASGEEKVRLRLWAAQHLIQGAEVDEGLRAAHALLDELGLSLPRGERSALARIAFERARVKLRGPLGLVFRTGTPADRLVLDALHGLSAPVRDVSFLPGSTLIAQYLRRALDAGDPEHAARALAYEALWRDVNAPGATESALYGQSQVLADAAGEPALIAEVQLVRGLACLARNQFTAAPAHLTVAHDLLKERCPGEPFLLTGARMYLGAAWFHAGNYLSLARHTGAWVDEARARDDRYAFAALTGFGAASIRHLLTGTPEEGLAELEAAMAPWPQVRFTNQHFGAFLTAAHLQIAMGPGPRLADWLAARAEWLEGAFLMRTPTCREALRTMRLWAALLAADSADSPAGQKALARAHALLKPLRTGRTRGAAAARHLYGGLLRAIAGHADEALRDFAEARAVMGDHGWYLLDGADYVTGLLEGGDSGRAKCATVRERIRAEGWADHERALFMRTPGLHLLR